MSEDQAAGSCSTEIYKPRPNQTFVFKARLINSRNRAKMKTERTIVISRDITCIRLECKVITQNFTVICFFGDCREKIFQLFLPVFIFLGIQIRNMDLKSSVRIWSRRSSSSSSPWVDPVDKSQTGNEQGCLETGEDPDLGLMIHTLEMSGVMN